MRACPRVCCGCQRSNQPTNRSVQGTDWVGTLLLSACHVQEHCSKSDGSCFKLSSATKQPVWATQVRCLLCRLLTQFLQYGTKRVLSDKRSPGFYAVMIVILIIALKGAVRDFLQSPHCAANCLQHVRSFGRAQSCANHLQHLERLSRATCRVLRDTKGQLSY